MFPVVLVNVQGTCRAHIHGTHSENTFREHSGNIQGTFSEHSGNIQETLSHPDVISYLQSELLLVVDMRTFSEHSVNIQ
jgi:hypothetical protein